VDLSVRYGIVTPYTSFLVEEPEMALREGGRSEIAEQVVADSSAGAEVSGEEAVNRSSQEKSLYQAEAPAAMPAMGAGAGGAAGAPGEAAPVRYVGDKTFVLHEGIWTDTTFDPDRMEALPVSFGSDDYFALVTARPDWGRYFSLGSHVIVVLEGTAYEVREGDAPPLTLPPAQPDPGPTPTAQAGPDNLPAAEAQSVALEGPGSGILEAIGDALQELWNRLVDLFN
jgi:Ca-activated chloride channel family protein